MAIMTKEAGKFVAAPWQLQDLAKLNENDHSANWSEMGCYKTSTVLWLLQHKVRDIENPRVCIVTTKSGKGTYFEAIPAILPGWTVFNVGTRDVRMVLPTGKQVLIGKRLADHIKVPHVVLTHYNVFARNNAGELAKCKTCDGTGENKIFMELKCFDCKGAGKVPAPWLQSDYLANRTWDFVALDEAHRIKTRDNKWTKKLKQLAADSKHRHVMTGTGFINRPDEIWSLLNFVDRKRFSSYWTFRDYFCEIDDKDGYSRIVGVKPEVRDEFRALVREIGVRRTLTEVMPHIKEPIFVAHNVELNPIQRRMYDQLRSELRMLDQKGEPIDSPNVLSMLNRLRQICVATPEIISDEYDEKADRRVIKIKLVEPSSKLDALMEIIDGLEWDEENRQQLVIFSNFKDPIELFKARMDAERKKLEDAGLDGSGYSYIHMEEKDNDIVRDNKWRVLFPQKNHRVFISTLQLGSESINLSCAQYVVFLDRSWSPKDNNQGIGRVRRPGQEGQPVVININAENTVDQRIEDKNIEKHGWFMQIFGEDNNNGD
jgi:SNF2 family DNA or RNA helicase